MPYTLYILQCADGTFYTGITNNLSRRMYEHQEGLNPKAYTYHRRPINLVWS